MSFQNLKENDRVSKAQLSEIQKQADLFSQESASNSKFQNNTIGELKSQIESFQGQIKQSNTIIEKLSLFKSGGNQELNGIYLIITVTDKQIEAAIVNDLVVTAAGMNSYDSGLHQALIVQLSEILNSQIDDLEISLQQIFRKKEIYAVVEKKSLEEATDKYSEEVICISNRFKAQSAMILDEFKVMERHGEALDLIGESNLEVDLASSPGTISELNGRQFSAMLFTSKNGENYKNYDELELCVKCGAKTFICPHSAEKHSSIVLPSGTTHLKLMRPPMVLKTQFNIKACDALKTLQQRKNANKSSEFENPNVTPTFFKIWGNFYNVHNGKKPQIGRIFTSQKILIFIQEIYINRWIVEEKSNSSDETLIEGQTFSDSLYSLFLQWYIIPELSITAIHDFLSNLEREEKNNPVFLVFCKALSGLDDPSVWKYAFLGNKLISDIITKDKVEPDTYRNLIETMYPCRSIEGYENMEFEFKAFCKNRLQRTKIFEHMVHMVAKDIEPNFEFVINR